MTERLELDGGLVSIIIAAYKHEKYVRAAIQSALDQSYRNLELLVVDDGSPDGTWEEIKSMEAACRDRFQRVEFVRQENQGICETLNTLLGKARGEYFLRLDSDDLIKPGSVEKLEAFLRVNEDYVLAVGDNDIIDENGQVVHWTRDRLNTTDPREAAFKTFSEYLVSCRPELNFNSDGFGDYASFWSNYIPNGYLVRKKAMDQVKFTNLAPREDFFMMLQLAKKGRFKFFDEVLHSYRWHATNNIKDQEKNIRFSNLTIKHEMQLLKAAGDMERYRRMYLKIMHWKKRTKLKVGPWLELYRIQDVFDERKLYVLRLGSQNRPLFELCRNNTTAQTPWRLRAVSSAEKMDF